MGENGKRAARALTIYFARAGVLAEDGAPGIVNCIVAEAVQEVMKLIKDQQMKEESK